MITQIVSTVTPSDWATYKGLIDSKGKAGDLQSELLDAGDVENERYILWFLDGNIKYSYWLYVTDTAGTADFVANYLASVNATLDTDVTTGNYKFVVDKIPAFNLTDSNNYELVYADTTPSFLYEFSLQLDKNRCKVRLVIDSVEWFTDLDIKDIYDNYREFGSLGGNDDDDEKRGFFGFITVGEKGKIVRCKFPSPTKYKTSFQIYLKRTNNSTDLVKGVVVKAVVI